MTTLRAGGATRIGQVRPENQDNLVLADDKQLFAVADGMGGHRGGEVASEVAAQHLALSFEDPSPDGLRVAFQKANAGIVERASGDPDLRNMGTTLCAIALVTVDGEDRLAVGNVGDSRLYLQRAGTTGIEQITDDHSLVATLYRQGQLTKDEADNHPNKNILTRALGIDADVLVDVWELLALPGDRYLICSDGLFNEVTEDEIAATLAADDDPQQAAERLAAEADEAGGRDNITVVIVHVVGDGDAPDPDLDRVVKVDRAAEAPLDMPTQKTAQVPPPAGPPPDLPAPGAGNGDQPPEAGATGAPLPPPPPSAPPPPPSPVDGADANPSVVITPAPPPPDGASPSAPGGAPAPVGVAAPRTRFTWRVVLFLVVFVALVGAVVGAFLYFANNTYYVGLDGNDVVIYQGRPGGVLWLQPKVVETTGIPKGQVPQEMVADIQKGKDEATLDDARAYIARLREQIAKRSLAGAAAEGANQRSALPATGAPVRARAA